MADSGQKTERATPKKRRDERKKGNIFTSKDAVSVAVLLSSLFVLRITGGAIIEQIYSLMTYCMGLARVKTEGGVSNDLAGITSKVLSTLAISVGPIMLVVIVAIIGVTFMQTKMLFAFDSIKPKFEKINPIKGFQRLFSLRSVVEALKGLLKITVLLVLIYMSITGALLDFSKYLYTDVTSAGVDLFYKIFTMAMWISVAYVVLAGGDFAYQWWDYERQMKMSKHEVKEEYKQMEGDPKIKGKIKEMQRKRAQSRMMQQVPNADVIIKNPTHYAVALRYNPEVDAAPVVLAKGVDSLALRIIAIGEQSNITVVENIPLARALYAATELNQTIPQELYNAVAEVLVYLYRMDGKLK